MAKEPKDAAAAPGGAPAAAAKTSKRKKEFRKKKEKRVVPHGVVCIQATFNNTIVTLTDPDGRAVSWSSAGSVGFKGSRKGTPYAAQQAAATAAGVARDQYGMKSVEVRVKGPGAGTRIGSARAGFFGLAHQRDQGRDAGAAQRLPSAQAPPRVSSGRDSEKLQS